MKICVYAICKNEEKFVDRWMDAVSEADAVFVTDTGSTDHTVEKLEARGAVVYRETISPWRFDAARNAALAHVPPDADLCVSNDLDEVFEAGWRQKLESAWQTGATRARYWFVWSHTQDGRPLKRFPMEKIHLRQGYRWVHPVHEVLEYTGEGTEKIIWAAQVVLHHAPDLQKPRSQYLPLLELSVQENPQDDRARFWLGREYFFHGQYARCRAVLEQYLQMPSAVWAEERSAAMQLIGRCFEAEQQAQQARSWFFRAVAECPDVREPYLCLVRFAYQEKDWPLVYAMSEKALAIAGRTESYLLDEACWGTAFYDYGSIGAYWLGLYRRAAEWAAQACALDPQNERLRENLRFAQKKLAQQKAEELQ